MKITLLFLLFTNILFSQLSGFEDSYKRQIQLGKIDKSKSEYYDTSSRIFSNFKYGFSIKVPENWEQDNGRGMLTVFRTYNEDYGVSMSINILEFKGDKNNIPSIHQIYNGLGKDKLKQMMRQKIENSGVKIKEMDITKESFKGIPSLLLNNKTLDYTIDDLEVEYTSISHQFWRNKYQFTIDVTLPTYYYDLNKKYYDDLPKEINFLQSYDDFDF